MQRITRYPLLIKQILQYTEPDQDRVLTERALHTAERLLDTINEAIREQEGRNRLRILSQDLWIGRGYVTPTAWSNMHALTFKILQAAGPDSTDSVPRGQEIAERRASEQGQKRTQVTRVPMQ